MKRPAASARSPAVSTDVARTDQIIYTCRTSNKTALTKKLFKKGEKEKPLVCHYIPSYVRLFDLGRITKKSAMWWLQLVSARMSKFFTKVVKST